MLDLKVHGFQLFYPEEPGSQCVGWYDSAPTDARVLKFSRLRVVMIRQRGSPLETAVSLAERLLQELIKGGGGDPIRLLLRQLRNLRSRFSFFGAKRAVRANATSIFPLI